SREAVGHANWSGVVLGPQCQRDLQVWPCREIVLRVQTQSVKRDWFGRSRREVLDICASHSLEEIGQRFSAAQSNRTFLRIIVGNFVTPEVDPELQVMFAQNSGVVVADLILG